MSDGASDAVDGPPPPPGIGVDEEPEPSFDEPITPVVPNKSDKDEEGISNGLEPKIQSYKQQIQSAVKSQTENGVKPEAIVEKILDAILKALLPTSSEPQNGHTNDVTEPDVQSSAEEVSVQSEFAGVAPKQQFFQQAAQPDLKDFFRATPDPDLDTKNVVGRAFTDTNNASEATSGTNTNGPTVDTGNSDWPMLKTLV